MNPAELPKVTAADMMGWSIVTAGGTNWYVVELSTLPTEETTEEPALAEDLNEAWSRLAPGGRRRRELTTFRRAYMYIESMDFGQGQMTRLCFPMGLFASALTVRLRVAEERPLLDWSEADRAVVANLVNEADKIRRSNPRLERPRIVRG